MVRHRAGQAGIAQSVEHFTRNEGVVGSSPISSSDEKLWRHGRRVFEGFFVI